MDYAVHKDFRRFRASDRIAALDANMMAPIDVTSD